MDDRSHGSGAHPLTATVREYRNVDLSGGVLVVSFPQGAVGNALLTDHLLESYGMDHLAGIDSDGLPPVALVRHGKARFPIRMHADAASKLAVLRCETSPPPILAAAIARALLEWAERKRIARIVVLDHIQSGPLDERGEDEAPLRRERAPGLAFVANRDDSREAALATGARELEDGVISGVAARLLIEARFRNLDVVALFAEVERPEDAVRSALSFARALPSLAPSVRIDERDVEEAMHSIEGAIRGIQQEIDRAVKGLRKPEDAQTLVPYG